MYNIYLLMYMQRGLPPSPCCWLTPGRLPVDCLVAMFLALPASVVSVLRLRTGTLQLPATSVAASTVTMHSLERAAFVNRRAVFFLPPERVRSCHGVFFVCGFCGGCGRGRYSSDGSRGRGPSVGAGGINTGQ